MRLKLGLKHLRQVGSGAFTPTLSSLSLSASSIAENSAAGTVVGNILGTTGGSSLSLSDSAGSRFAISGTQIVAGSVATDYETATSHNITIAETLAGAVGSPKSTALTISVTDVVEAGVVLSNLSSGWTAGQNPPDWDTELTNFYIWDSGAGTGSQVRAVWQFNGGAVQTEAWQGVDTETYDESTGKFTFIWPLLQAANLAAGGTFSVHVEHRINGGPATSSNTWSDTLNALGVGSTAIAILAAEESFAAGTFAIGGTQTITGGSKIALHIHFEPNGAQSITAITANSGAITFTRSASTAATAKNQLWYADVAAGTTSLTISLTAGSCTAIEIGVVEIFGAAAGAPTAVYAPTPAFQSGTPAVNADGGVTCPTNGRIIFFAGCNNDTTFTGATKDAQQATNDSAGVRMALGHSTATGTVTASGVANNFEFIVTSAWGP
jgi:hypothetical protein